MDGNSSLPNESGWTVVGKKIASSSVNSVSIDQATLDEGCVLASNESETGRPQQPNLTASLGMAIMQEALSFGGDNEEAPNEKQLASEKYQKQRAKCRGGHTLRARYNTTHDKANEISVMEGQLPGDLHHALRFGQVGAPKVAQILGGTCVASREPRHLASLGGYDERIVHRVTVPHVQVGGEGSSPVVFSVEAPRCRGRKQTRVKDGCGKRTESPDYVHGWTIFEQNNKYKLNRPIIREGLEAHAAGQYLGQ